MEKRIMLLDMSMQELTEYVVGMGQPAFRAKQLAHWIYKELETDFNRMSNLPKSMRERLAAEADLVSGNLLVEQVAGDGMTAKILLGFHDNQSVESVLMDYPATYDSAERHTVCVSSQAGCAVGCPFCATGQNGFVRNLSSGEIVAQVLYFARRLKTSDLPWKNPHLTNIVLMGQGEPMANWHAVWKAIETLHEPALYGLGARHITVSTSGRVAQIYELAQKPLQVNLAVSLHAPDNALRDYLVPLNKRYPIEELMQACRDYIDRTGRRVSFEYALMDGINDSPEHARALANLVKGMLCHVNLIPLNATDDPTFRAPTMAAVEAFQRELTAAGIPCTVRVERGAEIDAACGQLRAHAERRALGRRQMIPLPVQNNAALV